MKRISTLVVAICLLALSQNSVAQSVTISTTDPSPISPAFGTTLNVTSVNDFSTTNNGSGATFNEFPKNKTTELTSPEYYYGTSQSTIYFKYNVTIAQAGGGTYVSTPTVKIIYSGGTITLTASPLTITNGTNTYYFAVTPFAAPTQFPAYTNFRISLTLDVPQNDRTVRANNLSTNALLGSAGAAVLPVKFSSFNAKSVSAGVALTWNVGTEDHVKGYEVERSTDQKNYSAIGFVAASGQGSYNFVDAHPSTVSYYRIKSVDADGKSVYSTIAIFKNGQSSIVLKAFPTPVRSELTIQHNTASAATRITVSSIDGRLLKSIIPVANSQQTIVDLSAAKAGLYLVRLDNGNGATETLKVIKQ